MRRSRFTRPLAFAIILGVIVAASVLGPIGHGVAAEPQDSQRAWTWGSNALAQLGSGSISNASSSAPALVPDLPPLAT